MKPLQLRDPDPTRAGILLGWARLTLYVATTTVGITVAAVLAWHTAMHTTAPGWVAGVQGVLAYLGTLSGGVATGNFVWTKPRPRHSEDHRAAARP